MAKKVSHSEKQAQAQFESIKEMVEALRATTDDSDAESRNARDEAECAIQQDPLEVTVRSDWYAPGSEPGKPAEFNILLCTGGPACRIIGKLDEHSQPESAVIEHQDWGTPWTEWRMSGEQQDIVLEYCRQFYFFE